MNNRKVEYLQWKSHGYSIIVTIKIMSKEALIVAGSQNVSQYTMTCLLFPSGTRDAFYQAFLEPTTFLDGLDITLSLIEP